jgi:threonine 3-dehydrogenase
MEGKMRALVKPAPGPGARLVEIDVPRPGQGELLVAVQAASICGTDLHIYQWDPWAAGRVVPPRRLGHELAGTVVEIGDGVTRFAPGDYVSADSHIPCGSCYQCRTGRAHVCANLRILGVDVDGCFGDYALLKEQSVWKNDPSLPPHIACIQDPLGNAVYATLVEDVAGRSVAVMGCGPVGLFAVGVARAAGASPIFAIDVNGFRLDLARTMGATHLLHSSRDDVVESVIKATDGAGVDAILEMSGNPLAISQGLQIVTKGGRFTAFGLPREPLAEFDLANLVIFRGIRLYGITGREMYRTWYQMAHLLRSGALDPSPIITHTFALEEYESAFQLLLSPERECGKVVLVP